MAAVADDENFTLLYQVRPGVMEKSFGIQVARLALFPNDVIKVRVFIYHILEYFYKIWQLFSQNAQKVYSEFDDEHQHTQNEDDKILLEKINNAIQKLSTTGGNSADINELDLTKLVEQFTTEIEKLDSEYFKSIVSAANWV